MFYSIQPTSKDFIYSLWRIPTRDIVIVIWREHERDHAYEILVKDSLWSYMYADCIFLFYHVHTTKTLAARIADNKAVHHDWYLQRFGNTRPKDRCLKISRKIKEEIFQYRLLDFRVHHPIILAALQRCRQEAGELATSMGFREYIKLTTGKLRSK